VKIETERLSLRRWRLDDALPFIAMHDPAVMAWIWHRPRDLNDALAYFTRLEAHFEREGFGLWAVERRSDAG
jgi:RimJ/RimL family protein N-acetyltransferase